MFVTKKKKKKELLKAHKIKKKLIVKTDFRELF